jgi:hypothetical protein
MSNANVIAVTSTLLNAHQIKHTATSLSKKLSLHPDYPSLLCVSDSLTDWNIPNSARKVTLSALISNQIAVPFVAHLRYDSGRFILVTAVEQNQIIYADERKEKLKLPIGEFSGLWSGIILEARKGPNSIQPDYLAARNAEAFDKIKLPLLFSVILGMLLLKFDPSDLSLGIVPLLTLKILGTIVTSLLLMKQDNRQHPFLQAVCGSGKNNGCDSILNSNAAKLFPWLSWSEVGFFYFAGTLLAMLWSLSTYTTLVWLNIFALPYTIYSLGYQFLNKKWCRLCCIVQAILILEATVAVSTQAYRLNFSFQSIPFIIGAIGIIVLSRVLIKPLYAQSEELKLTKAQLKVFKYNPIFFMHSLKNQPRYAIADELMPIIFGNRKSQTVITMVSNPFCRPCAKSHKILEDWLKQGTDIQLKIVFSTPDEDADERTIVARHLVALRQKSDSETMEKALNEWYGQSTRNYETWSKKYPIESNPDIKAITTRQKEWCDLAEITHTPTFLIDGYKMPKHYKLEDLKYLIA